MAWQPVNVVLEYRTVYRRGLSFPQGLAALLRPPTRWREDHCRVQADATTRARPCVLKVWSIGLPGWGHEIRVFQRVQRGPDPCAPITQYAHAARRSVRERVWKKTCCPIRKASSHPLLCGWQIGWCPIAGCQSSRPAQHLRTGIRTGTPAHGESGSGLRIVADHHQSAYATALASAMPPSMPALSPSAGGTM